MQIHFYSIFMAHDSTRLISLHDPTVHSVFFISYRALASVYSSLLMFSVLGK